MRLIREFMAALQLLLEGKDMERRREELKKLYEQFGDWPTAIAAYNAGEGKMSRACAASGYTVYS